MLSRQVQAIRKTNWGNTLDFSKNMSYHFELKTGIRQGSAYIYELECIRGVAILLVFLFHAYGINMGSDPHKPSLLMSFIVMGNTGVTLFFVLSGFLLSQPWLKSIVSKNSPRPEIRSFYVARCLRVLPLYYCAVVFSILMSGNWLSGVKALAFGFVGFDIFPYSVVWWTLSTEVQFYLVLPLLFGLWFSGKSGQLALLGMLALWLYFYLNLVAFNPHPDQNLPFLMTKSLFGRLPAFLAGILAGYFYLKSANWRNQWADDRRVRGGAIVLLLAATTLLAIVLQSTAILGDRVAKQVWHIHHSYEAALWAVILLGLLCFKLPGRRLLINKPMAITGKLSYSLYLNHVPLLFFIVYPLREQMGRDAYASSIWFYLIPATVLLASLGLAYITYRCIELPFLNIKRKLPG